MYSLRDYGRMIGDSARTDAYAHALRQVINPGSVVLDVGTGTGIFALLACQFGARRVFAVEPDSAIEVARELAKANGYLDRIEFLQARSSDVTLRERADVVVSDMRGVLPLFQHHLLTISDVRQRLLSPGGVLIPERDTLWAGVVAAPELHAEHAEPWEHAPYGLDLTSARQYTLNTWRKARFDVAQLLAPPQCWGVIDYNSVDNPNVSATISWSIERAGRAHGLALWFDSVLAHNVSISNAPGEPELIYGNAFFPWSRPVEVSAGDSVEVGLRATLIGDNYVWCWHSRVFAGRRRLKAEFEQSTFYDTPLSLPRLQRRSEHYAGVLSNQGKIAAQVLCAIEDGTTLGAIADRLSHDYPHRFPHRREALRHVADLAEKYSSASVKPRLTHDLENGIPTRLEASSD